MTKPTQLPDTTPLASDARLDAPTFHRNIEPILAALAPRLPRAPGHILEVGSGTGQHITTFAEHFPDHNWHPADMSDESLASIAAWTKARGTTNVSPPIRLDAASEQWPLGGPGQPPATLDGMFSANVIHISPWQVTCGLLAAAGRHLRTGTSLFLYGPFKRDGNHTAPSNEAFDESLRNRDPEWGVRDLTEIKDNADPLGLELNETIEMPANNLIVQIKRR